MVDHTIKVFCVIACIFSMSASQFGPFFPLEMAAKGIDPEWTGFVQCVTGICRIFSSIIAGRYLNSIGRTNAVLIGIFLLVLQLVVFGSVHFIQNQ